MTTAMQTLRFERTDVTFGLLDDKPVLAATDLSEALGYSERQALTRLVRGKWGDRFREGKDYHLLDHSAAAGTVVPQTMVSAGVPASTYQGGLFLTESGWYKVLIMSRKAAAVRVQEWLVDEVMPQLARTGEYRRDTWVDQDGRVVGPQHDGPTLSMQEFRAYAHARAEMLKAEAKHLAAQASLLRAQRHQGAARPDLSKVRSPSSVVPPDPGLDALVEAWPREQGSPMRQLARDLVGRMGSDAALARAIRLVCGCSRGQVTSRVLGNALSGLRDVPSTSGAFVDLARFPDGRPRLYQRSAVWVVRLPTRTGPERA